MDYNDLPFDCGLRLLVDAIDHPSLQSPKQRHSVGYFATAAMDDKAFFDNIPRKKRTPRKRKISSSWPHFEIIHPKRLPIVVPSNDQQLRGDNTSTPRKNRKLGCEVKLESAMSILLKGNNTNSTSAKKPRENNVVKRQQPNKVDLKLCPKSPQGNLLVLIEEMRGTDVKLVIRKEIQQTDLQTHHNRMSIPPSKLVTRDFLTKGEENIIQNKGNIGVSLIDPCLDLIDNLSLRRWEMSKSFIYVLYNWNWVVKKNNFKQGEVVQLWSFRVAGEMWLALVREKDHPTS